MTNPENLETTAYYRLSARQFASECNWPMAAKQMRCAIELYPNPRGQLAQADLKRMNETLAAYEHAAANMAA